MKLIDFLSPDYLKKNMIPRASHIRQSMYQPQAKIQRISFSPTKFHSRYLRYSHPIFIAYPIISSLPCLNHFHHFHHRHLHFHPLSSSLKQETPMLKQRSRNPPTPPPSHSKPESRKRADENPDITNRLST